MRAWLISIIGITFLGLLIDIFIKDNKNMNYIKSIYGMIILYVVISPIISFLLNFKNLDFTSINEQSEFIETVNNSIYNAQIDSILNSYEIDNYFVYFNKNNEIVVIIRDELSKDTFNEIQQRMYQINKKIIIKLLTK